MNQSIKPSLTAGKQTTRGGLVLAVLVVVYSFARPAINEKMGWDLPAVPGNQPVATAPASTAETPTKIESTENRSASERLTPSPSEVSGKTSQEKPSSPKPGPLAGKVPKPSSPVTKPSETSRPPAVTKVQPADESLLYGILKDLGGERYITPAGLMFTRGSAEGHRLNHLERHTEDDPGRPGKHGVFDGGMAGALTTIDRAYERAKTGSRTTKEIDQGRTVYTVDMGGRVGFIGGREGNRLKRPMARRVRLVLDQNRVITAFPL